MSLPMAVDAVPSGSVPGPTRLRGLPLGASRPGMRAQIPQGYGLTGFQATTLFFPSAGCWRVWGTVRGEGISFVLRVTG
jgi:hypothetical protein